ncbi:hypothetical protein ACMGD3_24340 [Lysinibacillus sphaericus]|uniref:hypothetical protein n=1 Tax=Lysinibacillus sphaericus TaxID=1421 RepID=UPI003F7A1B83
MHKYQITLVDQKNINQNEGTPIMEGLLNDNILKEFKVKAPSIFVAFEQAKVILQSLIPYKDVEYVFSADYKRCIFKFINESNIIGLKYEMKLI